VLRIFKLIKCLTEWVIQTISISWLLNPKNVRTILAIIDFYKFTVALLQWHNIELDGNVDYWTPWWTMVCFPLLTDTIYWWMEHKRSTWVCFSHAFGMHGTLVVWHTKWVWLFCEQNITTHTWSEPKLYSKFISAIYLRVILMDAQQASFHSYSHLPP